MGCLKKIIYLLLAIAVIGLIASFLLPSKINFVHEQKLDSSPEDVFAQVNDLKNWDNWSVWNQLDPDMETTYGDKTVGQGAWYSWVSDNQKVGSGKMTIAESVPAKSIKTKMEFVDESNAMAKINLDAADGGGTNVSWTFDTEINNPIKKLMFNLVFKNMIKKNYGQGLSNLDQYVKDNPQPVSQTSQEEAAIMNYNYSTSDFKGGPALCVVKEGVKIADISDALKEGYGKVMAELTKQNLEMNGMPYCIYANYNEETMTSDMEMGIRTAIVGKPAGDVQMRDYPMTKAVTVDHYGSYETITKAHYAMEKYLIENNLLMNGAPWDVYVTDPTTEPDPSKWLTQVIYPIK